MLRVLESPEDTAHRHVLEMRVSLSRAGRKYLRYGETVEGRRYTIGVNAANRAKPPRETDDLPPDLKKARGMLQHTYRALRALADDRKDLLDKRVWPSEIVAWLDDQKIENPNSVSTVGHALTDLQTLQLAWNARVDGKDGGWLFGRNPGLPREIRQADGPSQLEIRGYCERMADEGVRRFSNGRLGMSKQIIWVPGEKDEYSAGVVVVTDAVTEVAVGVTERIGQMQVPTRLGGFRPAPAVRGELRRTEGKNAVVKLPGGTEVRTRILGDWHLQGLDAPEEAVADVHGGA